VIQDVVQQQNDNPHLAGEVLMHLHREDPLIDADVGAGLGTPKSTDSSNSDRTTEIQKYYRPRCQESQSLNNVLGLCKQTVVNRGELESGMPPQT
jgi:hypothetical protein